MELAPRDSGRHFELMPRAEIGMTTTSGPRVFEGRWFAGSSRRAEGAVWPTPRQELLLRSALLEGDAAGSAWERWSAVVDLDLVDPSSIQILPLAYRNLVQQGFKDDRLAAIKPRYAVTWGRNQKLFRLLRETLIRLHAAGIETLVVKGAALIPLYYRDSGVRGMGDFDVLVPEHRFQDAVRVLEAAGWSSVFWRSDVFDPRFEHALAFLDLAGNSVDLHCHLLMACCEPGADDPYWEASRPLEIEGVSTRTLCATDHLIQACVHGLTWVRVPPLRWVADAMAVMRGEPGGIDWDRLETLARRQELILPLEATLSYLHRAFDAPVPAPVLRHLAEAPVSRTDRLRFTNWQQNPRGRPVGRLLHHYVMFSRGLRGTGVMERAQAVPDYFRFWAGTDRLWRVPFEIGLKSVRTIAHRLGLYHYWDT